MFSHPISADSSPVTYRPGGRTTAIGSRTRPANLSLRDGPFHCVDLGPIVFSHANGNRGGANRGRSDLRSVKSQIRSAKLSVRMQLG